MENVGNAKDKNAIAESVSKHFMNYKVDEEEVISKFLKIKKDERTDDQHYLRFFIKQFKYLENHYEIKKSKNANLGKELI
jgi:hypothetical protein